MGGNKLGRPGRVRRPSRGQTLPAWPFLTVFAVSVPRRWLQNIHRKDHRGGRSSGRWGGFYKYGATGINAVQHYQEQASAASVFSRIRWRARAKSVYNKLSSLQCAREINSAEYGRRRRTGAAVPRPTFIGPAGRAKGGSCKMQTSLGAGARRVSAAALRTAFSRQGAVRGRASWPRLRRHLADKIGLPCPKDDQGKVFTRFPLDVARSSVEL